MRANVIILAGDSKVHEGVNGENKALLKLKGKPMVSYIIEALRASTIIDEIALIGTDHEGFEPIKDSVDHFILATGSGVDNAMMGLELFSKEEYVVIITSDIPLVTGEAIDEFCKIAIGSGCDFGYPIIPEEVCKAHYPDAKRTYIRVHEGVFTGGNIFLLKPKARFDVKELFDKFNVQRKNPLRLGFTLGFRILWGVLRKNLKIKTAEDRVGKLTGIKAKALICNIPEIGNDVDKPEDVVMIEKYLG